MFRSLTQDLTNNGIIKQYMIDNYPGIKTIQTDFRTSIKHIEPINSFSPKGGLIGMAYENMIKFYLRPDNSMDDIVLFLYQNKKIKPYLLQELITINKAVKENNLEQLAISSCFIAELTLSYRIGVLSPHIQHIIDLPKTQSIDGWYKKYVDKDTLSALLDLFKNSDNLKSNLNEESVYTIDFYSYRGIINMEADIVSNNTLIEIKTNKSKTLSNIIIYQAVAYALADLINEYRIEKIAFYFARYGLYKEWSIDWLLSEISGNKNLSVEQERNKFFNFIKNNNPQGYENSLLML